MFARLAEAGRTDRRGHRMRTVFAVLIAALIATAAQAAGPRADIRRPVGSIVLSPGDDIQAAVDANPAGTGFFLKAGVYRIQSVIPKRGDSFTGAKGAILNGAKLLDGFTRAGDLYVATGQPIDPQTGVQGECLPDFPRCDRPQDLYFDGRPLRAAARRKDVVAGAFFYDYDAEAVYFADDPAGHVVELSYRPFAFGGDAAGVAIRNLVVENYAAADQQAALGDHGQGKGWIISGDEVRWNHGYGVATGAGARITGNFIHHNGEIGVGGGASDGALVRANEIAFNLWNGTDCNWECGGAKWAVTAKLTVADNYVHDNAGPGLWTDIDCSDIVYEGNRIEDNRLAGISHEISGYAVIRNNSFKGNGAETFAWGWGGQIQIQNSVNVKVYGNTLVLDPARGGNGIMIIQQDRGARHLPRDNLIHDNDITMAGGTGAVVGWFADYKPKLFPDANNRWDANHYHLGALAEGQDVFAPNRWVTFAKWRASGQDAHSSVDGEIAAPGARE